MYNIYLHDESKLFSILSNSKTSLFRIDLPKMDRHTGDKWLIHGTKHHEDNQSQSGKHSAGYRSWECKLEIKELHDTSSIQYSQGRSEGRNIIGRRVNTETQIYKQSIP